MDTLCCSTGPSHRAAAPAGHAYLGDLDDNILEHILGYLDQPSDFACLAVQDKRMQGLVASSDVWQRFCQSRWPGCTAEIYQHDWRRTFSARAKMPGCFLRGVDQVVQICARAQANRAVLRNTVNDLMKALYQAELSALRHAGLKGSAEYRYARARVAWALSAFPEVIVDWVRHVHGGLIGDDFARFVWTSYWWRRSAMEFLASVAASAPGLCPSVPARLQAELRNLDATIAAIERRLGARELSTCAPAGLPQSHWWFHLGCAAAEV